MNDYIMMDKRDKTQERVRFCDEYCKDAFAIEHKDSELIDFIPTKNPVDLFDFLYDREFGMLTFNTNRTDLMHVVTSIAETLVSHLDAVLGMRNVYVTHGAKNLHISVVHQYKILDHNFAINYTAVVPLHDLFTPICVGWTIAVDHYKCNFTLSTSNGLLAKLSFYTFDDIRLFL